MSVLLISKVFGKEEKHMEFGLWLPPKGESGREREGEQLVLGSPHMPGPCCESVSGLQVIFTSVFFLY